MGGRGSGGARPGSGRPKGSRSKITIAFKEATQRVFRDIGGEEAYAKWAKQNQTEFYKIFERITPKDIDINGGQGLITVQVVQFTPSPIALPAVESAPLPALPHENNTPAGE